MSIDQTIWRKAHDLLVVNDWTQGQAQNFDGCLCVGGAIAAALTGNACDLYAAHNLPSVELALIVFAEHVDAPRATEDDIWVLENAEERVTYWNDKLPPATGYETVLRALEELDELEKAR